MRAIASNNQITQAGRLLECMIPINTSYPTTARWKRRVPMPSFPLEGDRTQETLSFGDYREVDGMKIPFTTQVQRPNSYTLVKYSEVKHNTTIEDSVFDPPGSPQR
jgi:hypothetical protein